MEFLQIFWQLLLCNYAADSVAVLLTDPIQFLDLVTLFFGTIIKNFSFLKFVSLQYHPFTVGSSAQRSTLIRYHLANSLVRCAYIHFLLFFHNVLVKHFGRGMRDVREHLWGCYCKYRRFVPDKRLQTVFIKI